MAWSTYCDESVLADANALDPQAAALSIIIHVLNLCAIYPEVHNLLFAENTKTVHTCMVNVIALRSVLVDPLADSLTT
jgi:hypothetical protein